MPNLYWNNFRMGQRYDAALREDALLSARELNNFDIIYAGESADIQIRPGYTLWNDTELPGPAQQLYPFVDMDQNFNLLGISNSRWRAIRESGGHRRLVNEAATTTRPVVSFGNRVFFGTDTDAYWTDDASIPGVNASYRMGIVKPSFAAIATPTASEGNITGVIEPNAAQVAGGSELRLNAVTQQRLAWTYVPASDQEVSNIILRFMPVFAAGLRGSIKLSIWTGLAEPLAQVADAISQWVEITQNISGSYVWYNFELEELITLSSGTRYWIQVESDDDYKTNYNGASFYVNFAFSPGHAVGNSLRWNTTWFDIGTGRMAGFLVGGMDPSHVYDYVHTFYNEDYNSESRPSNKSTRINPSISENRAIIGTNATLDPQVDYAAIYRRDIGTDFTIDEENITGQYRYIGNIAPGGNFTDDIGDDRIGAILHSEDHYLYDEADDTNQGKRGAFVPEGFVLWKGRIWAWEENSNKLYFTKTFEIDNPMGLVGESSPDYFPLDNVVDFPVPAGIINAKQLSNDQMAVYFRNEQIWILTGADSTLNPPPPHDIAWRPTYQTVGLFAPDACIPYSGSNIYLAREGLYRFTGIGGFVPDTLSETQTGIFDLIENQYFRDSKVVAYGREIWVLIDRDNDGDLDRILILDLERDFNTRGIVDRAWRSRTYPVAIADLAVHSTGDEFREILAADAVDGWIMKLNDGDDDNGAAIVGTAESHDIRAPVNAFINSLLMQPFYNDEDNLPNYEITLTSAAGDTFQTSITGSTDITGNEDVRGHTIGLRMKRPISVRIKVVMTSTKRDTIRGFTISYDGE